MKTEPKKISALFLPRRAIRKEKKEEKNKLYRQLRRSVAATAAVAVTVARRREDCGKRTVLIQTVEKRKQNGKSATAEHVGAENSVLRAENE